MDAAFTIEPLVSMRWGSASRHMRNVPVRLTVRIRFQVSRSNSWVRPERSIPAMLAMPSSRPNASTAVAMVLAASASLLTSATWVMHSPPSAAALLAVSSVSARPSALMSEARTLAPSLASRMAVAWPMPEAAPVTMATRSDRRSSLMGAD